MGSHRLHSGVSVMMVAISELYPKLDISHETRIRSNAVWSYRDG